MKKITVKTFILLGSNLSDPLQQVISAVAEVSQISQVKVCQVSHCYISKALGPEDQPDYINAVVAIDTQLSAHDLLKELQLIEKNHGRVRDTRRWGPRTLDLDILLYGDKIINTPSLIIPHPELANRNFVVYPLLEIAPNLILPNGQALNDLRADCSDEGLTVFSKYDDSF